MANFSVTVTHHSDHQITVDPPKLSVTAHAGTPVIVTWHPGPDTEITGVSGFPSDVNVEGPTPFHTWVANYLAPGEALWSYSVTSLHVSGARAERHDPEIDNKPPG